ncbi:MAG: hypothetical protein V1704_00720 [Candidatus Vogelbacteria bacterium]
MVIAAVSGILILRHCDKVTEEDLTNLREEVARVTPFMDDGEGQPTFVVVSEKNDLITGVHRVIVKLGENTLSSWSAIVPCDESGIIIGTKVKLQRIKYNSTNDPMQVYDGDHYTNFLVAERAN